MGNKLHYHFNFNTSAILIKSKGGIVLPLNKLPLPPVTWACLPHKGDSPFLQPWFEFAASDLEYWQVEIKPPFAKQNTEGLINGILLLYYCNYIILCAWHSHLPTPPKKL